MGGRNSAKFGEIVSELGYGEGEEDGDEKEGQQGLQLLVIAITLKS